MVLETVRTAIASALSASVGDRIYALVVDQEAPTPYLVLTEISAEPVSGTLDYHGLTQHRIQVDAVAGQASSAYALSDEVQAAMRAAGHLMVFRIGGYDPDIDCARVTADYYVWL